MRAGRQQLREGGHDQADPPVGLLGGADPGGGQAEGALGELEGVFLMQISSLGAHVQVPETGSRLDPPEAT